MIGGLVSQVSRTLGDLIFPPPPPCLFCQEGAFQRGYCYSCYKQIQESSSLGFCSRCGRLGSKVNQCPGCEGQINYYSSARGVGPYDGLWKDVLYKFKYRGMVSLGKAMGELMTEIILSDKRFRGLEVIVPVPIAVEKAETRLFNQAEILAGEISKTLRLPLYGSILYRKGGTQIQAKLTREERKRNLRGAYEVNQASPHLNLVKDKRVLLVDDVLTTGFTSNNCSRILKELGAQDIKLITWATGRVR